MELCRLGIARAFSANIMLTKFRLFNLNKMTIETCVITKLHKKYVPHCSTSNTAMSHWLKFQAWISLQQADSAKLVTYPKGTSSWSSFDPNLADCASDSRGGTGKILWMSSRLVGQPRGEIGSFMDDTCRWVYNCYIFNKSGNLLSLGLCLIDLWALNAVSIPGLGKRKAEFALSLH